ncbi:MAPEG family protein [Marinobacter sp. SS21]|uniref:MAPEG family protein n=1 Tax=Marinobacter sp. SS21 TaxID=2979460 RepID=UPI00232B64D2|nr:MAPEG family protein [Marinobacter sp. SS21]MDC0663682.1 MAPEG family protein [Marinobacter sp. SS21]
MASEILMPAMALVLWTLVMWLWMVAGRVRAVSRAGQKLDSTLTNDEHAKALPLPVRWKLDNYHNLLEQPILFYATLLVLAVAGISVMDLWLAWAYVGLRVAHSFHQSLRNVIEERFTIFTTASLILIVLAVRALMAVS